MVTNSIPPQFVVRGPVRGSVGGSVRASSGWIDRRDWLLGGLAASANVLSSSRNGKGRLLSTDSSARRDGMKSDVLTALPTTPASPQRPGPPTRRESNRHTEDDDDDDKSVIQSVKKQTTLLLAVARRRSVESCCRHSVSFVCRFRITIFYFVV